MGITDRIDPELRDVYEQLPEMVDHSIDPVAGRREVAQLMAAVRPPANPDVDRRDVRDGHVAARIYRPAGRSGRLPGILFIHGGGFILGTVDDFDFRCERLAESVGAVVASVDYRLAPEHPFPGPIEDCYAALRWLAASADELDVDADRIAVVGESSGGALAAGLALLARDRGEVDIALQMPLIAMLDDRHTTPSSHEMTDRRTFYREQSVNGWKAYLGGETDEVSPYAAPARAGDLAGLPPAFLMAGQLELMRDENIEYARRLLEAGVPTELHLYPGAYHGFYNLVPSARISQDALAAQDAALRRALHAPA